MYQKRSKFNRNRNNNSGDARKFTKHNKETNSVEFDFRGWAKEFEKLTQIPKSPQEERHEVGQGSSILFQKADKEYTLLGKPIDVITSPYEQILPSQKFYPLAAAKNVRASGEYMGIPNLDGGTVDQLNISEQSVFLDYFDSYFLRLKGNYRYLPIKSDDTQRGKGLSAKMIEAISEFLKTAETTTFTSLNFLNYSIQTDIPIDGISNYELKRKCNTPEGIFASLIIYQILLQVQANFFNQFNKMRANNGMMLKMCWDREVPHLNKLFSLFKKNAMLDSFKGISSNLINEYFDRDWQSQWNLISAINSREATCITSPLLEIVATYNIPRFRLFTTIQSGNTSVEVDILSTETINSIISSSSHDNIKNCGTIEKAYDYIAKRLSANDILFWARTKIKDSTADDRFNELIAMIDVTDSLSSLIKASLGDLRNMCEEVRKAGLLRWSNNNLLTIHASLYDPAINNFIVNDIYRSIFTGATQLYWNQNTHRWSIPTLWNYYKGIPDYDRYSGGAFLTFSMKDLPTEVGDPSYSTKFIPKLFSHLLQDDGSAARSGYCYAVNRKGVSIPITYTEINNDDNIDSLRLSPLSGNYKMRVPTTDSARYLTTINDRELSVFLHCSKKVFGMFLLYNRTETESNSDTYDWSDKYNLRMDEDLLAIIPVELESITATMSAYARTQGPIIVNEITVPQMGFFGLTDLHGGKSI